MGLKVHRYSFNVSRVSCTVLHQEKALTRRLSYLLAERRPPLLARTVVTHLAYQTIYPFYRVIDDSCTDTTVIACHYSTHQHTLSLSTLCM